MLIKITVKMDAAIEKRIVKLRRNTLPLFEKMTTNERSCLKNFNSSKRMRELKSEIRVVYGGMFLSVTVIIVLSFLEKSHTNIQGFLFLVVIALLVLKNDIDKRILLLEEAKFLKQLSKKVDL